jgi:hypothetical protein
MVTVWKVLALAASASIALSGCTVEGTPTWPGARLNDTLLTAADFPQGVQFDRITESPGQPDGQGGPPAMLSQPEGCSDGLTRVIAASAERGPGSAAKYSVAYDGARIVMTVLTSTLDLDELEATAARCELYLTYFDETSEPIPITTTKLDSERPDSLAYQQTMQLQEGESSVYFAFENVGGSGMFGIAFPTPAPSISVKGTLPQTFLDITAKQAERLRQR